MRMATLAMLVLGWLAGCDALLVRSSEQPVSLATVGRIDFGEPSTPSTSGKKTLVPLTHRGGAFIGNSAEVPSSVRVVLEGGTVEMTVLYAIAVDSRREAGYQLLLPTTNAGDYPVVYVDPDGTRHPVGTITID